MKKKATAIIDELAAGTISAETFVESIVDAEVGDPLAVKGPPGAVDHFVSPRTGNTVWTVPMRGEPPHVAKKRVRRSHGL